MNRTERAVLLTVELLDGREIRAADAAEMCGVSVRTAQRDLATMARVLAIYHEGGVWRVLEPDTKKT